MAESFQLLKKSQPKHSYALIIVYALRLFVYRLRLRSAPLYEWVEIRYVGSLWPSLAVFSIQLEHNTGQGHLRSSGKKGQPSKKKSWYGTAIHVFRSTFRKEHEKWSKNTFWKVKIGQKIKLAKMGKFGCFQHVLCHNSAIFEDIDLKFCTHIHQPLPSNILHAFLKILFLRGKCFGNIKFWGFIFFIFFRNFQNLTNPRQQFCSTTNST